jgi:hypothetical protein
MFKKLLRECSRGGQSLTIIASMDNFEIIGSKYNIKEPINAKVAGCIRKLIFFNFTKFKIPNYAEQCWIAVKVSTKEATCAMYVGTLAKERRQRHEKKKREKGH